jgi:hypothetical protein
MMAPEFSDAMKPTRLHYFFAREWPPLLAGVVVCLRFFTWIVGPSIYRIVVLRDWGQLPWLAVYLFIAVPSAPCIALLFMAFILGPIYHWRAAKFNGAPFRPGDRVRILVGPHRDRVTRVRSLARYDLLCVELGEEKGAPIERAFTDVQLLREEDPGRQEGAAPSP